jgi:hypothetical protein
MFQGILGKFTNIKFCKNLFIVAGVFTGGQKNTHDEFNRHVYSSFANIKWGYISVMCSV